MSTILMFIKGGGFMMYPLILCSIILISLAIERAITFRRITTDGEGLLEKVKGAIQPGGQAGIDEAIALCLQHDSPLSRVFSRGLKNAHRPADSIEMAIEQEAANERPTLEANLPAIKTIVNISPLLGLLGTIAGMITSFRAASQVGLSNPTQILGGIAEALISTATGITLAVIGFIAFNYFANISRNIYDDMEFYGAELVNFLTGRYD